MKSKRIQFEDDLVIVYNDKGIEVYRGIEDYEPNKDLDWEFDEKLGCNMFPKAEKEQKPIKMEVYEVGKGTTICGQDYKCKKDYKEGNCWYIKDVVYHCSRDGYLTDQNGISWSCTPEWFKEYIQSNTEWAEEEKTHFVGGQFLQCKLSFDGFKEGEHYWLEYVGNDMYVGRSDNILNQKFHITPRQLFTLFSQELEEVQGPPQEEKQVSLNYEPPFDENPSDKEIVEALIKHLKEQDGFLTAIDSVSTKAILSWLEKQKEQKVDIDKLRRDIYQSGYNDGYQHGKEDAQKEQKPAEWSEEDEACIRNLESIIYYDKKLPNDTRVILGKFLSNLRPQPMNIIKIDELEDFIDTELHKDEFIRRWPQYAFNVPEHKEGDEYSIGVAVGVGRVINKLRNFIVNKKA